MTERDFCYWLQGFFEITERKKLTEKEVEQIKKHLTLVFKNVTSTEKVQNVFRDGFHIGPTRYC